MTRAACTPRARAKPAKLTKDTRGDSQGRNTSLRRTSTVPEEGKPPPSRPSNPPAADNATTETPAEQSNGSPDSILSGPLDVSGNSAPDTAESVAPTVPFPPISHSPSSFVTESEPRKSQSRANSGRKSAEGKVKDEQRAFGSPVSVDDDDTRF